MDEIWVDLIFFYHIIFHNYYVTDFIYYLANINYVILY